MIELTPQQQHVHDLLQNNLPFFSEQVLKIKDKSGLLVPLRLNQAQMYIHNKLEKQLQDTGKVRALIPKARQMGSSTYLQARYYHKTTRQKGKNAFILSHDTETTKKIFDIGKRYQDNVPEEMRPRVKSSNQKELIFEELDSQYFVGTAGNQDIGRGGTVQYFHGSEVAFWKNTDALVTGVLQTISDLPGTEIVMESTGNGIGNMFHQMCVDAARGETDYQVIFIPWFWMDEYERDISKDFVPTENEKEIMELYLKAYDAEKQKRKLVWRRNKIKEFKSDWKFYQEYPSTMSEAFQLSTDSLIRSECITRARQYQEADKLAPMVMGVDPARTGDRTAIVFRRGREIPHYYTFNDMDEMRLVGIVSHLIDKHDVQVCNIDVAMGHGAVDRLRELGYKMVNRIHFGSKSDQPDIYRNKRAEMWHSLAQWLEEDRVNIPDSDEFHADLISVPDIKYTSDGTIKLESKENIKKNYGKSPDIGDAAALTFATPVINKQARKTTTFTKAPTNNRPAWKGTAKPRSAGKANNKVIYHGNSYEKSNIYLDKYS